MARDEESNYDQSMTEVERHLLRVGTVRTALFVAAFVVFLTLAALLA